MLTKKLQEIRAAKDAEDRGFTLIELLVVVVIIGILVAIAIPIYLNYEHGAQDRAAQSDLRNAATTIEACYSDAGSSWPASQGTSAAPLTSNTLLTCGSSSETLVVSSNTSGLYYTAPVAATPNEWTVTSLSKSGTTFTYDSTTGKIS